MEALVEAPAGQDRRSPRERRHAWILAAVAAVCLFTNLGGGSLKEWDEARYGEVAREMATNGRWHTLEWNYTFYHKKPPLAIWATALCYRLLGVRELSARLFSALCALGAVLVTFRLGRRILGGRAALLGGLVLATSPLWLKYARLGMLDAPLTLFVAAGILCYWRALEDPRWIPWIGFALAGALLTKSAAGLVLPAVIAADALVRRDGRVVRRGPFWLAIGAALAIGGAWVILQWGLFDATVFDRLRYHVVKRAIAPIEGHGRAPWYYLGKLLTDNGIWGGLGLAGAGVLAWRARRRRAAGETLLLVWIVVLVGTVTLMRTKIVWYLLPALPPLALAAGSLLDRLLARARGAVWGAGFAAALAAHLALCPPIFTLDYNPEIKAIAPEARRVLEGEDTLFLEGVPANAVLFYLGTKIRRSDSEVRRRLFEGSVRAHGRRYCLARREALEAMRNSLPASFETRAVLETKSLVLAEVRLRPGAPPREKEDPEE